MIRIKPQRGKEADNARTEKTGGRTTVARVFLKAAGAALCLVLAALTAPAEVRAAEDITFLLSGRTTSPAFGPWQVAKARGYYEQEGLNVTFQGAKGGVDMAKQVGSGTVLVGGGSGDTVLIVRGSGVPVKSVAVLGGKSLMQLVLHADKVRGIKDLKGKLVSTAAYHDTTFYALLGILAKVGMSRTDLQIEAAGRDGVWKLFAARSAMAMASIPDWIPLVEAEGAKVKIIPADDYFRSIAQAILVSDETIRDRPELVQKLVRATLRGMTDIMKDPAGAARDYVKVVPEHAERVAYVTRVFELYNQYVYPGQTVVGQMDAARLEALQDFYADNGIVRSRQPIGELYTNQFVQSGP